MTCEEFALLLAGENGHDTAESISVEDRERVLRALMGRLPAMVYRCADDAQWTMEFVSAGARGAHRVQTRGAGRQRPARLHRPRRAVALRGCLPRHPGRHREAQRLDDVLPHHHRDRASASGCGSAASPCSTRRQGDRPGGAHRRHDREREAEEALDLALTEWRQVFDSMDDSVMVLDGDGIVLRANAATIALSGLEMDEIVGARCSEVFRGIRGAAGRLPPRQSAALGQCRDQLHTLGGPAAAPLVQAGPGAGRPRHRRHPRGQRLTGVEGLDPEAGPLH